MRWLIYLGILLAVVLIGYVALAVWARRAPRPATLGVGADGRLAPLPASPNAVSTQTDDTARRMEPLSYRGDGNETMLSLVELIDAMPGATIVTTDDRYIHAEFRTPLVGYIDDVEFVCDDDARVVHYRSASRVGYSDLGANRKRMRGIIKLWESRSVAD